MSEKTEIKPIAHIYNDYTSKFGIPRQSGLCNDVVSQIVFEKEYRNDDALREIESFSHLWLIWHFSENVTTEFSPTVRPPRLGGNKRVGVFATRSPFRPNNLGLSCVKLDKVQKTEQNGTVLLVSGADIKNGTPIFDIKPYLPFTDAIADAKGGFADEVADYGLKVDFPKELSDTIEPEKRNAILSILQNDPRPSYHTSSDREYGFEFGGLEIKFKVENAVIRVTDIKKI